jgi:hypothetical protein
VVVLVVETVLAVVELAVYYVKKFLYQVDQL